MQDMQTKTLIKNDDTRLSYTDAMANVSVGRMTARSRVFKMLGMSLRTYPALEAEALAELEALPRHTLSTCAEAIKATEPATRIANYINGSTITNLMQRLRRPANEIEAVLLHSSPHADRPIQAFLLRHGLSKLRPIFKEFFQELSKTITRTNSADFEQYRVAEGYAHRLLGEPAEGHEPVAFSVLVQQDSYFAEHGLGLMADFFALLDAYADAKDS